MADAVPTSTHETRHVRAWGLAATAALGILIFAVFVAVQFLIELAFVQWRGGAEVATYDHFGLLVAVATLFAAPVGVGLILLAARLRRGIDVASYLGLTPPRSAGLWRWVLYLVVFVAVFHLIEYALGRPFVTEFQVQAFRTAGSPALLLAAIVLAAPVFEELFFRGFVFQGVACSRLQPIGAVLITAALWSALHVQYALFEIGIIFGGGVLLGLARWRSGSVYVPIALHALWNLGSAVETMVYLAAQGGE